MTCIMVACIHTYFFRILCNFLIERRLVELISAPRGLSAPWSVTGEQALFSTNGGLLVAYWISAILLQQKVPLLDNASA